MEELSLTEARRIALASQGFDGARGSKNVDRRAAKKLLDRISPLQIDSVNVLARAQYLPIFSRLGTYRRALLDDMAYTHRDLIECWGHEASFIPASVYPLLGWRRESDHKYWTKWGASNTRLVDAIYREVRERGPIAASDLKDREKGTGSWWGWSDGKSALEWLFASGRVSAAGRRNFERIYDLTERVVPEGVLRVRVEKAQAQKELLMRSARALGVGTAADLADYFRLHKPTARGLVSQLAEAAALTPVRVESWRDIAYLHPDATAPRRVKARALLSPFDSLIWERARTERLFGFRYRIEIYVPPPKRVHGYYVLPFLMDEELVARVDLKSDRKNGALLVQGAHAEPGVDTSKVAAALAEELKMMANWLDLDDVRVKRRGALAAVLTKALKLKKEGRSA